MDQSMWQTIISFDFLHHHTSDYKQCCHVGNTSQECWLGFFQDSFKILILLVTWKTQQINIRRNLMHFWKSHVRANKLDVQETDFSFSQFNESWNNFSWRRPTDGRHPSFGSLAFGYSNFISTKTNLIKPRVHQHRETRGIASCRRAHWRRSNQSSNQAQFFICEQSDCVEKPRDSESSVKLDASTNQNSNPDAASSSQGWHMDAQLFISTGKSVATDKGQKSLNRQDKSVISTGEFVATEYQGCSGNPEVPEDSEPESRIWPQHFRISPDCVCVLLTWRNSSRS